jgi:hypothetical protein
MRDICVYKKIEKEGVEFCGGIHMGMDIEKLATSAIEDAISKTDYITPRVNSGDKEPCFRT